MKHSSYAAILLLAAILISPSSDLLARESEGTLEKIARTGEFVIGYRTDASQADMFDYIERFYYRQRPLAAKSSFV